MNRAWLPLVAAVAVVALALPGVRFPLTALSLGLWGVAAGLEHLPVLAGTSDLRILVDALLVTALLTLPAVRWPEARPARWLLHLGALPALVGLLALALFAVGLSGWFGVLVAAAAAWAWSDACEPDARLRPPALALGWGALFALHALYVSGPGIQPAPVADRGMWALLQDALGALPAGLGTRLGLHGLALAGAIGFAHLASRRGATLQLRGGPAELLVPIAAGVGVLGIAAAGPWLSDVWRCPDTPHTTAFDDLPGTFQLGLVGDQLWANDREERTTRRFQLPGGAPLPPVSWEAAVDDAWPEELIPHGEGAWIALVAGESDGNVLVPVALDGTPGAPVRLPGCFVASHAPLPDGALLLGCEYDGEFLVFDPATASIRDRFRVPGLGSVEEVLVARGRIYAVALWNAPWLVEVDLETHKAARSAFAGDFNWALEWLPGTDLLAVPRFYEGRIDLYARESLEPRGRLPGAFGGRPLVYDGRRQSLIVAGTFSGQLRASGLDGSTRTLPIGGLVRTLALDGDRLFLGGRCGVRALDLAAWAEAG